MKKDKTKRGMEAVLDKVEGKRKPALKRKPGIAIMIAVGKPKPGMGKDEPPMDDERDFSPKKAVEAGKMAQLERRIAELEAEIARLKGHEADEPDEDTEEESY
jgi:hypothetical protein